MFESIKGKFKYIDKWHKIYVQSQLTVDVNNCIKPGFENLYLWKEAGGAARNCKTPKASVGFDK